MKLSLETSIDSQKSKNKMKSVAAIENSGPVEREREREPERIPRQKSEFSGGRLTNATRRHWRPLKATQVTSFPLTNHHRLRSKEIHRFFINFYFPGKVSPKMKNGRSLRAVPERFQSHSRAGSKYYNAIGANIFQ